MARIDLGRVVGTNGVSPKVDVTDIKGGHRVTITDADGTKSFDVMDGVADNTASEALNSHKLGNKLPEYYTNPRNLLDNSDFMNPVNQRGKTNYTGAGYTIDRWFVSTTTGTVSIGDDGLVLNGNDGAGYTFLQYIDNLDTSKVYTFAIKDVSGNVYLIRSTPNERKEETTPFGTIIAKTLPDALTAFGVTLTSKMSITLEWAALYEGEYTIDNLPPYVPKGYASELVECMRYYLAPTNSQFAIPVSISGYSALNFSIQMHHTPTISIESLNGIPVEVVEQDTWGAVIKNNSESTSQFRYTANADLYT